MVLVSRVLGTAKKSINYIEYLQSNGLQFIDTGVKGKSTGSTGTKVVLDLSVSAHSGCGLFGARAATGGSSAFNIFNYTDKIRADFYQTIGEQRDRPTNTRFKITMDNNKLQITQGSATAEYSFSQGTFTTPVNLYLFTVNTNGSAYNPGATAKLYGCQIYDPDGTLVRDFKPAKDSANVECLYDTVTKQYFHMQTITSAP